MMKQFSDLYFNATKNVYKKHGFANHKIVSQWKNIVGNEFAQISIPERISFPPNKTSGGILHINVINPGFALTLQAQENIIISKISTYFGYKAVARIKLKILPMFHLRANEINSSKNEVILNEKTLSQMHNIKDKALQDALIGLAKTIDFNI